MRQSERYRRPQLYRAKVVGEKGAAANGNEGAIYLDMEKSLQARASGITGRLHLCGIGARPRPASIRLSCTSSRVCRSKDGSLVCASVIWQKQGLKWRRPVVNHFGRLILTFRRTSRAVKRGAAEGVVRLQSSGGSAHLGKQRHLAGGNNEARKCWLRPYSDRIGTCR
jgi:hypothetical protein